MNSSFLRKKKIIILIIAILISILITVVNLSESKPKDPILGYNVKYNLIPMSDKARLKQNRTKTNKLDYIETRDFMSYNCKNTRRFGGSPKFTKNTPNNLYRFESSWFLCLDEKLAIEKNECTVFSFGVYYDYSFDQEMNEKMGCRVFSFDPIIEDIFFKRIRRSNYFKLYNSVVLPVNSKWKFYRYLKYLVLILIYFCLIVSL